MILPPLAQFIIIAILGAGLGSFSSALAYRIPRGISWAGRDRSRCPSCDAILTVRDLVPVLSWLMHRGRCRHCAAPVPRRYPLMEGTAMLMALALSVTWGWGWPLLLLLLAVPFLLAHIVIDAEHMILPDQINLILGVIFATFAVVVAHDFTVAGLTVAFAAGPVLAVAMVLTGWIMKILLKKDALGGGDVKFFFAAGWGVGFAGFPAFLMASGFIGLLTGVWWRWRGKGDLFPFGPAIIIAFFLCLLARGAGVLGAY